LAADSMPLRRDPCRIGGGSRKSAGGPRAGSRDAPGIGDARVGSAQSRIVGDSAPSIFCNAVARHWVRVNWAYGVNRYSTLAARPWQAGVNRRQDQEIIRLRAE
jgi:hypothetical protein